MAQPFHRHHSPAQWLRRLDRAAGRMNPYLVVLAIGLVLLNLTCFALLGSRLSIVRCSPELASCAPALLGIGAPLPGAATGIPALD